MNCWEFKQCPPDRRARCPASPERGKGCWKVTGTICGGVDQGSLSQKIVKCRQCEYYKSEHCEKF